MGNESIATLRAKLLDVETSLSVKYRVLFALKNAEEIEAHDAMLAALKDPSVLLRHEVAYCLGQTQRPEGILELTRVLEDIHEHPMVRHEAAEALGAICQMQSVPVLQKFVTDTSQEVRETCVLALRRIDAFQRGAKDPNATESVFFSVDPTPSAPIHSPVGELEDILVDEKAEMYDRYQALFALRNLHGKEAVQALSHAFDSSSALLKHEVAFVLGQMQDTEAISCLRHVLENVDENPMVRHEAAEALGSIADKTCIELLERYASDPEPIVADSCVVALDMLHYEQSGAFEYVHPGHE